MMKWSHYPRNIKVRLITSFFNRAAYAAVLPFMALFFSEEMNKVWAGTFLVFTVIVSFFVNLIGGYVTDRFNRKKVLLASSSLTALMYLLMTVSIIPDNTYIWVFAAAYIGFTVTTSFSGPAIHAIIIDSTTPENRKAVYALEYWIINLSMALGTAMGGLLYVNHKIVLFTILTIVGFCLPIAYWIWLEDVEVKKLIQQHKNVLLDMVHNYKIALQDSPFVKVVIGAMLIFSAEFSLNSYIAVRLAETFEPLRIGDFSIDGVRMLSILNVENMVLVVLLTFLVNRITDRFDKRKALVFGLIIYGLGYVAVTSANPWMVLIFFNFLATVGELIYAPIWNTEQANMMPDNQRGSYSAFSDLSTEGANLIARSTIILGAFLAPVSMSILIGFLVIIGSVLLYAGFFRRPVAQSSTIQKTQVL